MDEHERVNRAEELAERARELSAQAARVAEHAADTAQSEERLLQLERELADLDEEERKLDEEFANLRADDGEESPGRAAGDAEDTTRPRSTDWATGWADRFAEKMEAFGARIGEAMSSAFSSRPFGLSDTVEREVTVDAPTPVDIDTFAGKVTVRSGASDRVRVVVERHGWNETDRDDITVDVDRDERGVHVRCASARGYGHRWASVDVEVPPTSPTSITTQGGSIRVESVGGPVTASTRGGAIRVDGAAGEAKLDTLGGPISLSAHTGPVSARTKGGSLRLSGKLTDHVDAETMGGSISIEGVDATVRAQTMGGSVTASGRFRGESSISTVGGSVNVALVRTSNVRVEGSGTSASAEVDGLTVSRGRIDGMVGDGSDGTLRLRTAGGSVRVQLV